MNGPRNTIHSTEIISPSLEPTVAFKNLTISNGPKTLLSNISVSGTLNLDDISTTENIIFTEIYKVDLKTTGTLARPETAKQYIYGKVVTTRPIAEAFGEIGISFITTSTSQVPLTVTRTTGISEKITNGVYSAYRYFDLTAGALQNVPNLAVKFSFLNYELTRPIEEYKIYRRNFEDSWSVVDPTTYSRNENYYTVQNLQDLGRYTIGAAQSAPSPLPVELTWFKAQRQAQGVLLTWETASEEENSGFEVQVSTNGKTFSKVAFVESKVVNSSVKQRYSYTDNAALAFGTRYYRLAQIDLDGTTTYSNIKAVDMDTKIETAAAFPNPFADGQEVMVRLPQGGESRPVRLVLTNTLGQVILEQQAQVQDGQVEFAVNTAKANAKGMYLLNVIDNGSKYTFKLVKK
ncbi:T9SS C-terminal target domain-containing protein [Pontibacter diazotrophicus]|uniref:T9SS C-terminal target domain-containing protein n=2 Tax=Pontibacter diazotrophicus TaxID=1400979 RepID=A0A3D8LFN1_9BACT|nr:T9SS C-terminal target domain-containing protein [Pontibacter diazotrophicus]